MRPETPRSLVAALALVAPVDGLKSAVVKECGARVTTPKRSFTVE